MTNEPMSPGEIGRHLGRIEATLSAGFSEIKAEMDRYVLKSVHEAEMRNIEVRFKDLEGDLADEHDERKRSEADQQQRHRAVTTLAITTFIGLLGVAVAAWAILDRHLT